MSEVSDTSGAARSAQQRAWQRMGGTGRLRIAIELSDDVRSICLAGIHARRPGYTPEQARHALFRVTLGDPLYQAAWPNRPLLPS